MVKDFWKMLKNELSAAHSIEPTGAHLEETIRLARQAYINRRQMRHISTFEMIIGQVRFIAQPVWLLQGMVLLCMCGLIRHAMVSEQAASSFPAFLSISSIFIAMTMLPFYGRSRKFKMREIECTTRVSLSRLTLSKLCVIGAGDAVSLCIVTLITLGRIAEPAVTLLIFIILPFLLTCAGSLFILGRTKENYGIFVSVGFGIGLSAAFRTLAMDMGDKLTHISAAISITICAFLALVLILECRRLLRQIPSPDLRETLMF